MLISCRSWIMNLSENRVPNSSIAHSYEICLIRWNIFNESWINEWNRWSVICQIRVLSNMNTTSSELRQVLQIFFYYNYVNCLEKWSLHKGVQYILISYTQSHKMSDPRCDYFLYRFKTLHSCSKKWRFRKLNTYTRGYKRLER
jgi:hypothetical protein